MRCEACLQAELVTFNTCYKAWKLTWGNQRATALSLVVKGSVVAEKRHTRCPSKGRFLIQGTHCITYNQILDITPFKQSLPPQKICWCNTLWTLLIPPVKKYFKLKFWTSMREIFYATWQSFVWLPIFKKSDKFSYSNMKSRCYTGPTQIKLKFSQHLLVQISNTKYHKNMFSRFGKETRGHTDITSPLCIILHTSCKEFKNNLIMNAYKWRTRCHFAGMHTYWA
jgi:hypothetical protein